MQKMQKNKILVFAILCPWLYILKISQQKERVSMEFTTLEILDLAGTIIFALTGAVKGVRKRLDIFGVTVLACCVGVGGGITRDVILGSYPVTALSDQKYILICILTGIISFATARYWMKIRNIIQAGDAIGLGVFTFLGAQKAVQCGAGHTGIILCGIMTAIGGGIIRDVFTGNIPVVLKSDFYATASMDGAIVFCLIKPLELPLGVTFIISAGTVSTLRLLAIRLKLQLPAAGYLNHGKKNHTR